MCPCVCLNIKKEHEPLSLAVRHTVQYIQSSMLHTNPSLLAVIGPNMSHGSSTASRCGYIGCIGLLYRNKNCLTLHSEKGCRVRWMINKC